MSQLSSEPSHFAGKTSTFKCDKCKKSSFTTPGALANHQAALNHYMICPECHKQFNSRDALSQHSRLHKQKTDPISQNVPSRHALSRHSGVQKQKTVRGRRTQPLPLAPATPFSYRAFVNERTSGRKFLVIPEDDHDLLEYQLLGRCHSSLRLQLQGYRLTTAPPEKKRKKMPPSEKKADVQDTAPVGKSFMDDTPMSKDIMIREKLPAEDAPKENSIKERPRPPGVFFAETPEALFPRQFSKKRKAIVLDCEMVGVGEWCLDELAFLSAVDFFTGEVLIHGYVQPTQKVTQWRSRYSGVTRQAMAAAVDAGRALPGWESARQALWHYSDANTVLIGHGLQSDLKVLRLVHPKIVDTSILTSERVFNPDPEVSLRRLWALKALAKEFLDRNIQVGKKGHDCLEDTFATRDVAIWCLKNPALLSAWAENAKAEYELRMEQLKQEREARECERKEKQDMEKQENQEKEKGEMDMDMDMDIVMDESEPSVVSDHGQNVRQKPLSPGPDGLDYVESNFADLLPQLSLLCIDQDIIC
ncbi:ribonuclease H-like domain-containing protein [Aspergillus californicus]